jgi:hypothetical protein
LQGLLHSVLNGSFSAWHPHVSDAACAASAAVVLCRIYILAELLAAVLACSIFAVVSGAQQHTIVSLTKRS